VFLVFSETYDTERNLKGKNRGKEPDLPKIWNRLSLRSRLLLPMAAMIIGALLLGGLALQIVSPDQFEYENEQGARSAGLLSNALNAALAVANNPQQTLDAFAGSLGTSGAIKFHASGAAGGTGTARVHEVVIPAWFISVLSIPELGANYPIKIGVEHVGDIVFAPDLSADIFEKWIGFLAVVTSGSTLMLLAALSAYLTTGTALRPLAQLGAGLTRMRAGDYETSIPLGGPPEIRKSCEEANQLASTLKRLSWDNRGLLRKLVSVQDDERREVARELHDEMGPLLFGIRANVTAMFEETAEAVPEPGSPAHGVLSAAEALLQANRRILERLSPLYVAELGLFESIQALLRNARAQAPDLKLTSKIDHRLDDLDGLLSLTAYRVLQEGITNVLRHAQAETADVLVALEQKEVAIEISDDGIGFPSEQPFGRGLIGMRERVRALNGSFEILRENRRTRIRCRLAVEHRAERLTSVL
jgi:two-component system sensor histidine kinase UhpB